MYHFGFSAEDKCKDNKNCKNGQCDVETGHCVEGCISNHYGRMCENECACGILVVRHP